MATRTTNSQILEVIQSEVLTALNEQNRHLAVLNGRVGRLEEADRTQTALLNENCRRIAEHDTALAVLGVKNDHTGGVIATVSTDVKTNREKISEVANTVFKIGVVVYIVAQIIGIPSIL